MRELIKRILRESVDGPKESVVIDKVNPFNHPEYKKYIREYSKDLKDGDIFVVFDAWGFGRFLNNLFGKKTIRFNDEVENIIFSESLNSARNITWPGFPESDSPLNKTINLSNDKGSGFLYYNNGKLYTFSVGGYKEYVNEKLKDYLEDKIINPYGKWEGVPNEFFEIRKVQRQETDFK